MERFRDELGDWRLTLLTPVRRPGPRAVVAGAGGAPPGTTRDGDRRPSGRTTASPSACPRASRTSTGVEALLFPDADEVEDLVVGQVANSALFASRFRENAARALLLPRRRPGTRTPLWQQRQRAADLLAVASRYGSFPILVETYRECLSDVFDLPALREILGGVARREIAVHGVETPKASPFASSLLFDYVAAYMYDGDAPLAERRAGALTLDRDLLRELLGQEELRELLDPDALADLELSLQALADDRQATTLDQVHDLLRRLGDLSAAEVAARTVGGGGDAAEPWLAELASTAPRRPRPDRRRRALDRHRGRGPLPRRGRGHGAGRRAGGVPRAGRPGPSMACWRAGPGPTVRSSRPSPARRWGLPVGIVDDGLGAAAGRRVDPARRVPARWRRARVVRPRCPAPPAPPVAGAAPPRGRAGRSASRSPGSCRPGRASCRSPVRGVTPARSVATAALERLAEVVDQLAGVAIPASVLERDVLPSRVPGYQPRLLDELGAMGEVGWVGRGSLGRDDGRIALFRPGRDALRPPARRTTARSARPRERHERIRDAPGGAWRLASTARSTRRPAAGRDREVLDALWDLVWAGEVTNDTFAPAPRAALEAPDRAARRRSRAGARGPAGSPRWATRGRRPLVARRAGRPRLDAHGAAPRHRPSPSSSGTAS